MKPDPDDDPARLERLIRTVRQAELPVVAEQTGRVVEFADGLARVSGLPAAGLGEFLHFEAGALGFVLSMEAEELQAVVLDGGDRLAAGGVIEVGEHGVVDLLDARALRALAGATITHP